MSTSVSKQVLEKTSKCIHGFSCLESGCCGTRPLCEIDHANGEDVLFLKAKDLISCPYRVTFGHGQLCTCPTRFALCTQ